MPTPPTNDIILRRALAQTAALLERTEPKHYGAPTPCTDWTVEDLVRHIVAGPANFIAMYDGHEVDWTRPPTLGADPAADFRQGADALMHRLEESNGQASPGPAIPEFAVHSWDLAQALRLDWPLDTEVAEVALAFMREHLQPDDRRGAFEPQREVSEEAPAYDRLAAFAGRTS